MMTEPTSEPTPKTRHHYPEMGSLQLRGRIWHIEYWVNGKWYRESSRSPDQKVALKLLK